MEEVEVMEKNGDTEGTIVKILVNVVVRVR